ncbi:MAG: type II secretion system F family protein [Candidatus Pacearchaeota archaeon]|nr:type II secretion system F family protein [Candidatus Pacearchaeota archaeon]
MITQIEQLKKNIDGEIKILGEISNLFVRFENSTGEERRIILSTIDSLSKNMKMINRAIPKILESIVIEERKEKKEDKLERIEEGIAEGVVLKLEDKEKFLTELNINEEFIKKLKKKKSEGEEKYEEFKKARGYLKLANRFFLESSISMVKKGYFSDLYNDLKKSNLNILLEGYVAMMLLTSVIAFCLGVFLFVFFMLFDISFSMPLISAYKGGFFPRFSKIIWLPLIMPLITFIALYIYPSTEAKSIEKNINEELPFAVVHMSSISGSGIAPVEIFKIIGNSKDYPYLKRELRKVLNQINIYGYDLVSALNNVSKSTPSAKLSALMAGLSTTINTGGNLSDFFQKRADSLLLEYKLDKEKFIKVAETFMDIYISVVIAAPMIIMLLLIMISISGLQTGFSPYQLTFITIAGVAFVNIIFLAFLQTKKGIA